MRKAPRTSFPPRVTSADSAIIGHETSTDAWCRRESQRRPNLPILLASGYCAAGAAGSGFRLMAKPYGIVVLSEALREITDGARDDDTRSALGDGA